LRSFGVIFVSTATTTLLFIPKIYFIYFSSNTTTYAIKDAQNNMTALGNNDSIGDFQPSQADFNVSKLPPPAPAPSRDANWSGYGYAYNKPGGQTAYVAVASNNNAFKRPPASPSNGDNEEQAGILKKLQAEVGIFVNVIHQLAQKLRQYEPSFVDKIFSSYSIPQPSDSVVGLPGATV